jgi:phosphatidylglycerol---prolipoprotein diacylglyceryl transferase
MYPVLWQLGPLTIYSYGVLAAAGVLLGLLYARSQAPRAGLNRAEVWNLGIYMVLAALVGAKLWLVLIEWPYFWAHPREMFSLSLVQSGGTFFGGILGGIAFAAIYTWYEKMPILPLLDTYGAAVPLGHAVGRVGCFLAGCCYGKPTSLPWGVKFTSPIAEQLVGTPIGVPLHPTQLYEAAAEIANFIFLVWLGKRQRFAGEIAGAYLVLYGIERGLIEIVRGDPDRTLVMHGAVSLMQIVSVGFVIVGSYLWWRGLRGELPMLAPNEQRHA